MAAATAIGSATGVAVTTTPGNSGDKDIATTTRSDAVRVDIANRAGDLRIFLQGKDANGQYFTLADMTHRNNVAVGAYGEIITMLPDTIRLFWVAKTGSGTFDYAITGRTGT